MEIMRYVFVANRFKWATGGTGYGINSRALMFKMESLRLGRWAHFETFGNTGKISILFAIQFHFHSEY